MAVEKDVVVLFVDVRGFTRWSEANEVFANLDHFVEGFLDILGRTFTEDGRFTIKPLGDGAMLVGEIEEQLKPKKTRQLLGEVLKQIRQVEKLFQDHCGRFARRVGHQTNLDLGWGIVRGKVLRVGDDWAGGNLNKCSRLCNEARPFGIIIDRDDFPELPRAEFGFLPEVRRLVGISDDVPVWVTPEISSQFVPRERLREQPEVHVAGTCVRSNEGAYQILVSRRSQARRLYPGKLEGCGGQLRLSESFSDGVKRHFKLDLGIDVTVLTEFHNFYEIREPNEPLIPGIRFLCRQVGDAEPHSHNNSEIRWISDSEFERTPAEDFVGGLKEEVLQLLAALRLSEASVPTA